MILLSVTQGAACIYLLVACVLVLNRMSWRTRPSIVATFILLTVASGMGAMSALDNKSNIVVCLMAIVLTLYLTFNGRVKNVS